MNHALDLLTETAARVRTELETVDVECVAAAEHHAELAARRDDLTEQYSDLERAAATIIAADHATGAGAVVRVVAA